MKTSVILNFVLAIAVVVLSVRLATSPETGNSGFDAEKAVLDNIATRTSIRDYTNEKVSEEQVSALLKAGMAAPTAMNKQPWHFVVVDKREGLDNLADANPNAEMLKKAPLAIVVCGDMDKAIEGKGRDFWIQDASAATENILLAAHAMGLGAVWTGLYPMEDRADAVAGVLHLPKNLVPLCAIVIGHPAESPKPKDKFKEENVSYNSFGQADGATASAATAERALKPFDVTDELSANPFKFFTGDGLLLAAGSKSGSNAMTIGWGAMGTLWRKPIMTVYVAQGRYTHQFMEANSHFTVMTFKDKRVLNYMGHHSGRDGDKAKALGLHILYTKNGTPYYAEADMVIECRTMYGRQFDPKAFRDNVPKDFYKKADAGLHSEYIGEVVSAMKR